MLKYLNTIGMSCDNRLFMNSNTDQRTIPTILKMAPHFFKNIETMYNNSICYNIFTCVIFNIVLQNIEIFNYSAEYVLQKKYFLCLNITVFVKSVVFFI